MIIDPQVKPAFSRFCIIFLTHLFPACKSNIWIRSNGTSILSIISQSHNLKKQTFFFMSKSCFHSAFYFWIIFFSLLNFDRPRMQINRLFQMYKNAGVKLGGLRHFSSTFVRQVVFINTFKKLFMIRNH